MKFDKILTTEKKFITKNTRKYILVHHTGNENYEAMYKFLAGPKHSGRNVSCHYVIAQDARIAKIGEHLDSLWHAGNSFYKGAKNFNYHAIGIEICSNGFDYSEKQREIVVKLVREILDSEQKIVPSNILRHAHVSGYRGKWDVGPNFYEPIWGTWENFQKQFEQDSESITIQNVKRLNLANISKLRKITQKDNIKKATRYLQVANKYLF
jgi:N-acetyl-anhydromuramyl-L-alanine amidase AmpD